MVIDRNLSYGESVHRWLKESNYYFGCPDGEASASQSLYWNLFNYNCRNNTNFKIYRLSDRYVISDKPVNYMESLF